MENEIVHMPEQIQELTLLLMYLTSWQERRTIGLRRKPHKTDDTLLRRCWKGYDFSVLERLEAQGLICGEGRKNRSCYSRRRAACCRTHEKVWARRS